MTTTGVFTKFSKALVGILAFLLKIKLFIMALHSATVAAFNYGVSEYRIM